MNLLGAIQKKAALWDKLLTKGLLGAQSITRLGKGIPSHLGQSVSNSSLLGNLAATGSTNILQQLRNQMKMPNIQLQMPDKINFLKQRGDIQTYVNRYINGKKPFKPIIEGDDSKSIFSNGFSALPKASGGHYAPSINWVKASDRDTLRHELGHFFSYQRMSPAKSLMLRQKLLEKAKQHYPELIPPGLQMDQYTKMMGKGPVILEEATAQAIASSGKSQAAQRFRKAYASMESRRPQDAALIERANKIDPSGQHASVINQLLHNYQLNTIQA